MPAALGIVASSVVPAVAPSGPTAYVTFPRTMSNILRQSPDDNPTITNMVITCRISQDVLPAGGSMTICERWLTNGVGTNRFIFRLDASAKPAFLFQQSAATQTRTSTVAVPYVATQWFWLRMTFTPDNGASQHIVKFETCLDGSSWATLDTVITGGVASMDAGTGYLAVGGRILSTLGFQGGLSDLTITTGASTLFQLNSFFDLANVDPLAAQFRTVVNNQLVLCNRNSTPQMVLVPPPSAGKAVRFASAANRYSRASFGLGATDYTFCCWAKLMVPQATYSFFASLDNGGANYVQMGPANTGVNLAVSANTGGQVSGLDMTVGLWVFFANVTSLAGADQQYYAVAPSLGLTVPGASSWASAIAAASLFIGGDGFSDYFGGSVAAVKAWTAALTKTELETEMGKYAAVRTANLYANYRFNAGPQTTDDSGNSRVLTQGGTAPTTDNYGPPCT